MMLIEKRGGFLYEHRPDVMPFGYLSNEELALWSEYYARKEREQRHG